MTRRLFARIDGAVAAKHVQRLRAQIPTRDRRGGLVQLRAKIGRVDPRVLAPRLSAFDRDRTHQEIAGEARAFERGQHPRQNVEIASPPHASARGVYGVEGDIGGRADDGREKPRERGGALELLACVMDMGRPVLSRLGKPRRRRPERDDERGARTRHPGLTRSAHARGASTARARSRSANFCTLPVEVLGISAKTT